MDDIFEHLGKSGLCIYLDPKKAFDTVDHSILLHKMYNYGMYSIVYDWFKSYLSYRLQYTAMQHFAPDNAAVTSGVPSSSVLGPILFLIYMNDTDKAILEEKVKLFADDTNLFLFDKDSKSVSLKATQCLNKLSQ